jgi:hypothetical protein
MVSTNVVVEEPEVAAESVDQAVNALRSFVSGV